MSGIDKSFGTFSTNLALAAVANERAEALPIQRRRAEAGALQLPTVRTVRSAIGPGRTVRHSPLRASAIVMLPDSDSGGSGGGRAKLLRDSHGGVLAYTHGGWAPR